MHKIIDPPNTTRIMSIFYETPLELEAGSMTLSYISIEIGVIGL